MIIYYYKSMHLFRFGRATSISVAEFSNEPSECRWMVPGTFDHNGDSTL